MASEEPLKPFIGKRGMKQLGARAVEGRGSSVSSFAKKMMAKFGWEEGMGLGKGNDGITTHVVVNKKDESEGIGFNKQENWTDQWWFSSYAGLHKVPTDEELFAACGGRRLGMRARGDQSGKWERAEATVEAAVAQVLHSSGGIGEGAGNRATQDQATYMKLLAAGRGTAMPNTEGMTKAEAKAAKKAAKAAAKDLAKAAKKAAKAAAKAERKAEKKTDSAELDKVDGVGGDVEDTKSLAESDGDTLEESVGGGVADGSIPVELYPPRRMPQRKKWDKVMTVWPAA
ncbi:Gpatch4 [Symbiodinium sp. KB8]|nr:Gpatch4 [Symbiodinium sp. KB8]